MKRFLTFFLLIIIQKIFAQQTGVFEYYVRTALNGTNTTWGNFSGGTAFASTLGTVSSGSNTLVINLTGLKTFKNNGGDVTAATLFYRVYKQGTSAPSYSSNNLPFFANLPTSGDQEWQSSSSIDLLSGVTSNGTYNVEIYLVASTNLGDRTYGSSGSPLTGTFDRSVVLGVDMKSILVQKTDNSAVLNWITTSEDKVLQFNIQRSANNQTWQTIGSVKATNNPSGAKYNYVDDAPLSNINYYRLQMVDNDGKMTYSKVVAVSAEGGKKSFAVYPNPVKSELNLLTDGNTEGVSIYDMTGRAVLQFKDNRSKVNVSDLPNGVYFVRLMDKNGLASEPVRFVKQ